MTNHEEKRFYTPEEIWELKLLPFGRDTIYAMLRRGELPRAKFGRRYVIPRKRFEEWLDALGSDTVKAQ